MLDIVSGTVNLVDTVIKDNVTVRLFISVSAITLRNICAHQRCCCIFVLQPLLLIQVGEQATLNMVRAVVLAPVLQSCGIRVLGQLHCIKCVTDCGKLQLLASRAAFLAAGELTDER